MYEYMYPCEYKNVEIYELKKQKLTQPNFTLISDSKFCVPADETTYLAAHSILSLNWE